MKTILASKSPRRKEILSTLIFVPATAGLLCGQYVINDIISSIKNN